MTRIGDMPRRSGPVTRASLWFARRKLARLAGRGSERMVEPLQALAHAPTLLFGYGAFELACERVNRVEHRLKQLAVLKAATVVNCEYCIDIGSAVARRSGCSDEQLLALASHRESELFSELEKLVLDYAAAISRTPATVSADLVAALREHFDDRQLVELTNAIALENMRARFNAALDIGSAGFSEGMVCAVAQTERDPQTSPLAVAG
jgi:AhpD family alkylhydroperoxidase